MVSDYTGPERRKEIEPGRLGRRHYDWHCGEHALIQATTRDHRTMVCGKIAAVQQEIRQAVSWKVVGLILPIAVIILGSGFGYFAIQLDRVADKQDSSVRQIGSSLNEIKQSQAVMQLQIGAIKERQDVLRDIQQREERRQ